MNSSLKIAAVVLGCVALLSGASVVKAEPVGELTGSFQITVSQGGSVIATDTVTFGSDLADIKINDGTSESCTQIGTIGAASEPIILKVVSDGGALEDVRVTHWYIDVPIGTTGSDIWVPGSTSLFDPNGGSIDVTISGLCFDNGVEVTPIIYDNDTYLTSYMRDIDGHFYESTSANPYNYQGMGIYDIQVSGENYLDGNTSDYNLDVLATGTSTSWTWANILNPGTTTTVHDGTSSGVTSRDPGYVFELGLSMAFVAVPEPATLAMLVPGFLLILRRRFR